MGLMQGLIVWGIVVVVAAILLFLFWKFFLCTRTGYESKKSVMAWGIGVMLSVIAAVLFIPLMITQADVAIEDVMRGLQNSIVEDAGKLFEPHAKEELTKVFDNILSNKQMELSPELEELKNNAIENGIKYAKNKPFYNKIETALKTFKFDDQPVLNVDSSEIGAMIPEIIAPYGKTAIKNAVKMKLMKPFTKNIANTTSFAPITGIEMPELVSAGTKAITKRLSKFFIILGSICAAAICVVILIILLLLKDPKEKDDDLEERRWLFEFDRRNKNTGKKISEEINQYN